jgi:hypothetical protein
MSPHGGKRDNAGRPSAWNTQDNGTVTIRLPSNLAAALLKAKGKQIKVESIITALNNVTQSSKQSDSNNLDSVANSNNQTNTTQLDTVTQSSQATTPIVQSEIDGAEIVPPLNKCIQLPKTKAEYESLVEQLKQSQEWQIKNGTAQNVARIFKQNGVVLPSGKMSKAGLVTYLNEMPL